MRRTHGLFRRTSALVAAAVIAAAVPIVTNLATPAPLVAQDRTIVVEATADATVFGRVPLHNFGRRQRLVTGAPVGGSRTYVRFEVPATDLSIDDATLVLHTLGASGRINIRRTSNDWGERTITYRNAPVGKHLIATVPPRRAARTVHVDITRMLDGSSRALSFVILSGGGRTSLSSRQSGAHGPKIKIHAVDPSATPTPTVTPTPTPTASPDGGRGDTQPTFPIRAAFYYPWFPETWGSATSPFTNYHPSAGLYDSSSAATIAGHIDAMRYGGIQAGISSWWGQGTKTDQRVPTLLRAADGTDFRWTVYYEPESLGDPSAAELQNDLSYLSSHYGSDSSFLRIDGRFVVFVYADGADACAMASRWQQANTVNAYLVLKVFSGYKTCTAQPDGWHQYGPASATADMSPYSYTISPGFWKKGESARLTRDLSRWNQQVAAMTASNARFQLVTTFNEWGEGTAVESATEWASASGYGKYLDALHGAPVASGTTSPTTQPSSSSTPTSSPSSSPTPIGGSYPMIAAGGDIACDPASGSFNGGAGTSSSCHMRAVSDLLVGAGYDAVLPLGDIQYENGVLSAFQQSYDPSWGRVLSVTHPVPGNHEYHTAGATGYYGYFGSRAGDPSEGYYGYDIGAWHVIALNSNCGAVGGCGAGSPQETWLKADMAAHPDACTLAYWHHPRFSSGEHGDNTFMDTLWRDIVVGGVDVALSGHDHDYERFAPMNGAGSADASGVRSFVVGTGGKSHYAVSSQRANSQVVNDDTYGVLRLTLMPDGYAWKFVAEAGRTFTDAGTGVCH